MKKSEDEIKTAIRYWLLRLIREIPEEKIAETKLELIGWVLKTEKTKKGG
jgi:hypothetical protein